MSRLFHLELYLYCLSFKSERAIQGQLPKVFLPMIGVLDGGMCGTHSLSTSTRSSSQSRDCHRPGSFILSFLSDSNLMAGIQNMQKKVYQW